MSNASDIAEIDAAIASPASASVDGNSVASRSAADLIALQDRRRELAAQASPAALFRGMNCKIVPPGGA